MARLVGTGKDPNGQYGAGVVFDVPRDDPHYAELIDNGWAEWVDPHDDPARGTVDIAQAAVRGDALLHPAERDIADHIGDRAHAIVQRQDPDAQVLTADDDEQVRRRQLHANPDERAPDGSGGAATSGWADGPSEGDLATHTTLSAEEGRAAAEPRYPGDPDVQAQLRGEDVLADGTAADDAEGDDQATDAARELAAAEGVNLDDVQGTGKDGRITKDDVEQHVSNRGGGN